MCALSYHFAKKKELTLSVVEYITNLSGNQFCLPKYDTFFKLKPIRLNWNQINYRKNIGIQLFSVVNNSYDNFKF